MLPGVPLLRVFDLYTLLFKAALTMTSSDVKGPSVFQHPGQVVSETAKGPAAQMATIQDDDERLLAQIGYEQVGSLRWISKWWVLTK